MMTEGLERYLNEPQPSRFADKAYNKARKAFLESERLTVCDVQDARLTPLAPMGDYRDALCRVAAVIYGFILHKVEGGLPNLYGIDSNISAYEMFSLATSFEAPQLYDVGLMAYVKKWPNGLTGVPGFKNGGVLALTELLTLCFASPDVTTVVGRHPKTSLLHNRYREAFDLFVGLGFTLPNSAMVEAILTRACESPTLHAFDLT